MNRHLDAYKAVKNTAAAVSGFDLQRDRRRVTADKLGSSKLPNAPLMPRSNAVFDLIKTLDRLLGLKTPVCERPASSFRDLEISNSGKSAYGGLCCMKRAHSAE